MRKHFRAENDISAGVGGGAVLSREEPQWFQGEKRKLVGTKGPERGDEIASWHRICRRRRVIFGLEVPNIGSSSALAPYQDTAVLQRR